MRRLALVSGLAAVDSSCARAITASAIAPTSIAGVKLGLHASAYKTLLGSPVRNDVLENDYSRLVFTTRKVSVYLKGTADTGVEIATWNKAHRTAAGVGPCSTLAKLKASKHNIQGGKVYAYTVGKLIFVDNDQVHVGAVALYSGRAADLAFASFVPLNETTCS